MMEKPEKGSNNNSSSLRIKFNDDNDADPASPYKKAQMSLNTHLSFHLEPKPNPLLFTSSYKQVYLDEANKELVIIKDDNTILRQPTDQQDKKIENYAYVVYNLYYEFYYNTTSLHYINFFLDQTN